MSWVRRLGRLPPQAYGYDGEWLERFRALDVTQE